MWIKKIELDSYVDPQYGTSILYEKLYFISLVLFLVIVPTMSFGSPVSSVVLEVYPWATRAAVVGLTGEASWPFKSSVLISPAVFSSPARGTF